MSFRDSPPLESGIMSEKTFLEKAESCRRLAENTFDERAARILREIALEYEARHLIELSQRTTENPHQPRSDTGRV